MNFSARLLLKSLLVLPVFYSCTTTSQANELEGPVSMVGSAPNARPVLDLGDAKTQTNICPGPKQDYLRKFSGTFVKLSGDWSTNKITKEKCFEVSSFQVTQITKGRPAMIGTLKNDNAKYTVESDDGKKYVLETPSKGVKALAGKKVITDLVPAGQTSEMKTAEQTWKIVSYMEYPAE